MKLTDDLSIITIGVTGPSGAGKGVFSACLAGRGLPVIDADAVYHELLVPPSPCLDALVDRFGATILRSDGSLDRSAMAALVFSESEDAKQAKADLERISHAFVTDRIQKDLRDMAIRGIRAAVIDAPLLIEAGLTADCDLVVAVLADRDVRLSRLRQRDGRPDSALNARLDAQPSDDFYRQHADVVVLNQSDTNALQEQADAILGRMGLPL